MKTLPFLILALSISFLGFSQERDLKRVADSIKAEGEKLYRSEWASGHGSSIFSTNYAEKKLLSGGYFSYETNKDLVNIFFSKDTDPKVIATIKFNQKLDDVKYKIDTTTRKFTDIEKEIYTIREKTVDVIKTDTLFQFHPNTDHNLVPIVENGIKKVYIITAQTSSLEVLLGNDYLINFDSENNIINKIKLHNNLIPLPNGGAQVIEASSHVHLGKTSDFITATDVCIFKFWKPKITWVITFVQSAGYVSAWHFRDEYLDIYTQAQWEKIMKNK